MNKEAYKLFHEGTLTFADIEQNGIRVDVHYCKTTTDNIEQQIEMLELELERTEEVKAWKKLYEEKFNIDSNDQLKKVLFGHLKITPPSLTKKGNPSVDKDSLHLIDSPITKPLIQLRQLKKMNNTYLKNIIKETVGGYLHPFFNLNTVQTFRSSSDKPNFQNMPIRDPIMGKTIRQAFIPREGGMIGGLDYAGIELSMAGCNSKDPFLINDFSNIHKTQAALIYKLKKEQVTKDVRFCAKNGFVFPQLYGSWHEPCAVSLWNFIDEMQLKTTDGVCLRKHLLEKNIKNITDFVAHIKKVECEFWQKYRTHKKWQVKWIERYNRKGYIEMLTGFRCGGVMTKNQLLNYSNQGIAFHCLLWSIIQMNKWLKKYNFKSKIIGQIHDDMVMDINIKESGDVLQKAHQIMCVDIKKAWDWIVTPLEIEGEFSTVNWYEKQFIKI
ncbi:MAG: hypothetical protein GY821_12900 [Gammaproteobacteria bacterium]|nr:hypothetical protein [Gammaproteobacteria bacterium]